MIYADVGNTVPQAVAATHTLITAGCVVLLAPVGPVAANIALVADPLAIPVIAGMSGVRYLFTWNFAPPSLTGVAA